MKTFEQLEVGERFHYGIDANGHEPYLYKLSDTEAYVERGSGTGTRETVDPDTEVEIWNEPATLHDAPTEVERAALTLLLGPQQQAPNAEHPGLNLWIDAMLNDPEERRSLDRFIWEEEAEDIHGESVLIREACREMGYVCWESEWDRDNSASGAILDRRPSGSAPQTPENRWWAAMDDAAYRLASAVRDYRVAGRPAGDYTSGSVGGGLGSTLGYVETSLAAAIVEYHHQVANIYAGERGRLEMALRDATPDDLITQTEAAQIANITPQAINNAIRDGRLRAYSDPDAVAHRPGDRRVSEAAVRELWPPRE
jgi:hypothetical protein